LATFFNGANDQPLRQFASTLAHEVAHAWLVPVYAAHPEPVAPEELVEARERSTLALKLRHEWDMLGEASAAAELDERQAVELAAAWGYLDGDVAEAVRAAECSGRHRVREHALDAKREQES
jgi:hypothetical protein